MKHKSVNEFTELEKEMLDSIALNHILAQADGYQLGYAQAIKDFTDHILDYW